MSQVLNILVIFIFRLALFASFIIRRNNKWASDVSSANGNAATTSWQLTCTLNFPTCRLTLRNVSESCKLDAVVIRHFFSTQERERRRKLFRKQECSNLLGVFLKAKETINPEDPFYSVVHCLSQSNGLL